MIVNIDVPSVEAGITFYIAGLGFALKRRLFQRTVAEMVLGDSLIYLIQQAEGSKAVVGADLIRTYRRHWTPVHIDVIVDNLDLAVSSALKAGALLAGKPTDNAWGKQATLADPFGHGVCLLEFSTAGYDSVEDD